MTKTENFQKLLITLYTFSLPIKKTLIVLQHQSFL